MTSSNKTGFEQAEHSLDRLFAAVPRRNFLVAGMTTVAAGLTAAAPLVALASGATVDDKVTAADREHMGQAIRLMRQAGVIDKTGGPFGAVVVRNGEILSASGNSVLRDSDPTAHAEVNAIRAACKKAGSPHIDGAVMFSSCEPCPMCYSTAFWARLDKIYYAASWDDYADLFDDSNISMDMKKDYADREVKVEQFMREDAQKVWLEYRNLDQKTRY